MEELGNFPFSDIQPGHMVGAHNVPFTSVLMSEGQGMKQPKDLMETFYAAGLDLNQPITATCGSGES